MNAAESMPGYHRIAQEVMASSQTAFAWWAGELITLLPERLRRQPDDSLVVEPIQGGLQFVRETPDGPEVLAKFDDTAAGQYPTTTEHALLRLPEDMVLSRRITLAAAAAENLHEVVGFQLDRYTPFLMDEVYLGCRIVGHDGDTDSIDVSLTVVPRIDVDDLRAKAATRGVTCQKVAAATAGAPLQELDLGTRDQPAVKRGWQRVLWIAAAFLVVIDLALPLVRGQQRLAELRPQLTALRQQANAVAALRNQVDQDTEQAALPMQRWRQTPLSALLTELTRRIPDGAWVTQMQLDSNTVQLVGFAASANGLIPALEQSPLFANAAFRSPVTQDPVHGVEQFQISLDMRRHAE